jgi:soluble lytic murein transglycosylase-like protein
MRDSSAVSVVTGWVARLRPGSYVHDVIHRLEADVAARKQPRAEWWPVARHAGLIALLFFAAYELGARSVDSTAGFTARVQARDRLHALNLRLESVQGKLDIQTLELERLRRAHEASAKYGIGADLALKIEEIALSEGIDPKLAFDLVRVESEFNQRAVSPVGALGYTQLMPATAKLLVPGITREGIFDRDTNLRLGFRFLRSLINHYHGDIRLALLAYNRGPARVDALLAQGIDPGNGYTRLVLGK